MKVPEEAFANLAFSLIGKFVREVKVNDQAFCILFENGSEILICLGPEHYEGPEAVGYQGQDNKWAVL